VTDCEPPAADVRVIVSGGGGSVVALSGAVKLSVPPAGTGPLRPSDVAYVMLPSIPGGRPTMPADTPITEPSSTMRAPSATATRGCHTIAPTSAIAHVWSTSAFITPAVNVTVLPLCASAPSIPGPLRTTVSYGPSFPMMLTCSEMYACSGRPPNVNVSVSLTA
jgi:hypothetical protein